MVFQFIMKFPLLFSVHFLDLGSFTSVQKLWF